MAKILVVDDDEGVRRLIEVVLVREGHNVIVAENGQEALEFLKSEQDIALVFTDLVMPKMNGAVLVQEVNRRYPNIKVIVQTAHREDARLKAIEGWYQRLIIKPYTRNDMLKAVDDILIK
jgi:DNA-binding NtrC family response regulator